MRLFPAVLLLAALVPATAPAAPPRDDPRVGILGAVDHRVPQPSDAWPWTAIGRVNRAGRGFCTGTLIAPDRVLTAAHCLWDGQRKRWANPDEMHFVAGYDRSNLVAHAAARSFIVDPVWREAPAEARPPAHDWAVLVLAERLPVKPVPLVPGSEPDETVTRAGYGSDRAHMLALHRDCRITAAAAGLLLHDCDSAHGDSGSPLLRFDNGRPAVVAIHVAVVGKPGERRGAAVPAATFAAAALAP